MLFVAPIAALLIQLGISRQREFCRRRIRGAHGRPSIWSDQRAGKTGRYNKRIPMDVSPTTASLFIVAPLTAGQVFSGLFSTHPPLSERIAVLRNMTITR